MINTMPRVKQLDEKIQDIILEDRFDGLQGSIAASADVAQGYVIYSMYYADEPEKGYVVYSHDHQGWDFFGYMPVNDHAHISQHRLSCSENCLL
jgi:hypothetical protein